jgi:dynein heavy chain, axonemal
VAIVQCLLQVRNILVQTTDTARYTYLLNLAVSHGYPCIFVGPTGTGKSVYVLRYMDKIDQSKFAPPITICFSARTSAGTTQHMVDAKLDRRRKGVFGPAAGKKVVIFVDDLNMPLREKYGAQPPIEILRQYMDHDGWCASLLWL